MEEARRRFEKCFVLMDLLTPLLVSCRKLWSLLRQVLRSFGCLYTQPPIWQRGAAFVGYALWAERGRTFRFHRHSPKCRGSMLHWPQHTRSKMAPIKSQCAVCVSRLPAEFGRCCLFCLEQWASCC